jgi:hypothetical protein
MPGFLASNSLATVLSPTSSFESQSAYVIVTGLLADAAGLAEEPAFDEAALDGDFAQPPNIDKARTTAVIVAINFFINSASVFKNCELRNTVTSRDVLLIVT